METKKKIIDLGILESDEISGVKRISIVEEPAIMLDFQYFNTQKFVKPSGAESEEEFISRCIPIVIKEGKDQEQASAICYAYWQEDMNIDVSGLPAYVDQVPKKKKDIVTRAILAEKECDIDYSWTKDEYVVETILALAKELGTKEADIKDLFKTETEFEFANVGYVVDQSTNPALVSEEGTKKLYLYKYSGTPGERAFCRGMMSQRDVYFTKANIKALNSLTANPGFGHDGNDYSIWDFKGGPNCKHYWEQYLVEQDENGNIIGPNLVKDAAGRAGRTPYSMPRHGYYNKHAAIFNFAAEEQQILVGPAMIPNLDILRVDDNGQKYFVKFSPETIKEIAMKYMKQDRNNDINTDHEENSAGAYIFESWLVETPDDKANTLYGYEVPAGTWMISVKVEDPETWKRVKSGELRGFSIEGILVDMEELESQKTYERIKKILGTDI